MAAPLGIRTMRLVSKNVSAMEEIFGWAQDRRWLAQDTPSRTGPSRLDVYLCSGSVQFGANA
jgi:hypothetical protein